jgi:glycosyltransferase involved in cell wall biosynthesis
MVSCAEANPTERGARSGAHRGRGLVAAARTFLIRVRCQRESGARREPNAPATPAGVLPSPGGAWGAAPSLPQEALDRRERPNSTTEELRPGPIKPLHVSVAIITFKRPDGLRRLLTGLHKQQRAAERPFDLTVVVVDNDAERSAEPVAHSFSDVFTLRYVPEARQGIPIARNAALDAVPEDSDFVCFIDDDEWPCERWLDAFVELHAATHADCYYGPVEPVYPAPAPQWFVKSCVFERRKFADGARLSFAASNNVMISMPFLRKTGLRFDDRMRFTGGSDYLFFRQAVRLGLTIRWADEALVYDSVPSNRMNWSWICRRQYRIGNTFAISERIIGRRHLLIRRSIVSLVRIALGTIMLPMLLVSPYYGMRGVSHALRGAGMLIGLMGHRLQEYAPDALELERRS